MGFSGVYLIRQLVWPADATLLDRYGHSRRSDDNRLSPIVEAMEPLRLGVPELADD
jgi:hypothetical protein